LVARRRDAHHALLDIIRSERYNDALQALVNYARHPPIAVNGGRKASGPVVHFARRVVKRRWHHLAATVDAAHENPTESELHHIRSAQPNAAGTPPGRARPSSTDQPDGSRPASKRALVGRTIPTSPGDDLSL